MTGSASRLLRRWNAHAKGICALAWSPDGRMLASGGNDATIRLWDVESEAPIASLHGHEGAVRSIDWSPDGRHLVSGAEDGRIGVWTTEDARAVRLDRAHRSWINSVRWSPDGRRYASASGDGTLLVHETGTRTALARLRSPLGTFMSIAWSPDASMLAAAARTGSVLVWRTREWTCARRLETGHGVVWNVEWSPADRLATAGEDGRVVAWDVASGRPDFALEAHARTVARVAFCASAPLLATLSHDETIGVWDVSQGALLDEIPARYPGWVYCLAFHPRDAVMATTDREGRDIELWAPALARANGSAGAAAGPPYRAPLLAHAREVLLGQQASGRSVARVETIAAEVGPHTPRAADAVRTAAGHLQSTGEVVALDRGRVFLAAGRLAQVRTALAAHALGRLAGEAPIALERVPEEVFLGPWERADAAPARDDVEQAFIHRVLDEESGWLGTIGPERQLWLPETAAPLAAARTVSAEPIAAWQPVTQAGARVAALMARLVDTTLFDELYLHRDGVLLKDATGTTYELGRRHEGGAVVVTLAVRHPPGAAMRLRAATLIAFLTVSLREIDPSARRLPLSSAPGVRFPADEQVRWSAAGQGSGATWPLAGDDLGADVSHAVALLREHADDERRRQRRLCSLHRRALGGDYDVVICHRREDERRAVRLRAELEDVGVLAGLGPECSLTTRPDARLAELAARTGVIAVLVGRNDVSAEVDGLHRAVTERRHALLSRTRWVPVVLPEAPSAPSLPPFLHSFDWVRWHDAPRADRRAALTRLVAAATGDRARS